VDRKGSAEAVSATALPLRLGAILAFAAICWKKDWSGVANSRRSYFGPIERGGSQEASDTERRNLPSPTKLQPAECDEG